MSSSGTDSRSTPTPAAPAPVHSFTPPALVDSATAKCASCAAANWGGPIDLGTTAGDLLILVVTAYGQNGKIAIGDFDDSSGSVWHLEAYNQWVSSTVNYQYVFYAYAAASGASIINFDSVNPFTAGSATIILFELAGVNPSTPFDGGVVFALDTTSPASATITTTLPDDTVLGILSANFAATVDGHSGTEIGSVDDGTYTLSYATLERTEAPSTVTTSESFSVVTVWGQTALAVEGLPTEVTVSPNQGPAGAAYTVTASGFTVSAGATLSFNGIDMVPDSCTEGSFVGSAITTSTAGSFMCTFAVPNEATGIYSILGTDLATDSNTNTVAFTLTTPAITVTPGQGPQGAALTVTGTGFSVSTSLMSLAVDSVVVPSCTRGALTTNSSGTFGCTFPVPAGTSGTSVVATDAGGRVATGTFTVTIPSITVAPGQGPRGATVAAAGTGFSLSSPVGLVFDGVPITSCTSGTRTTNGSGAFGCTFVVPAGTSGAVVLATDVGGQSGTATFNVTTPAIAVTPAQGPEGATVLVSGDGFSVSSVVGLMLGGATITNCTSGSRTTSGSGALSCTLLVPSGTTGTAVTATDIGGQAATGAFTVTTPGITVTPGQGPVGAMVTVAGTGFSVSSPVGLVLDGVTITSCTSGSATTSGSGTFSCAFSVPGGTAGVAVIATDVGGRAAMGTFAVTIPAITVTPAQGPQGATVLVSGGGFSVSSPVGLVLDGVTITNCTSGSRTTSGSGALSCTFLVPSGTTGTAVTATDIGGQAATGAFTVTTPGVPGITVTPGQGPVGTMVTVAGTGFSVSSSVGLVFDGIAITSCVSGSLATSGSGTFSCTFSVPGGTTGTAVTVTDTSGQTATGAFTAMPGPSSPGSTGWVWVAIAIAVAMGAIGFTVGVALIRRSKPEP